jgi:CxxC-x17-CxxC domain-containing protein
MPYGDRLLRCIDCGADFVFTAAEQEHSVGLGLTYEPKRCPTCRRAKRITRRFGGRETHRPQGREAAPGDSFPAVCVDCGRTTRLPFRPRGNRPVYCTHCYSMRR